MDRRSNGGGSGVHMRCVCNWNENPVCVGCSMMQSCTMVKWMLGCVLVVCEVVSDGGEVGRSSHADMAAMIGE